VRDGELYLLQVAAPRQGVRGLWVEQFFVPSEVAERVVSGLNGAPLPVELLLDLYRDREGQTRLAVREIRLVK
jgi:hypothetical protein